MKPIKIFITSFFRSDFLLKAISSIEDRTQKGDYEIHVFDNGSDKLTLSTIKMFYTQKIIKSYMLSSENYGCTFPKKIFPLLIDEDDKYFMVTDNDFIIAKNWLPRMIEIMDKNPDLAMLAPQYWPHWPMSPGEIEEDYVNCKGIGNTFKLVRVSAFNSILPQLISFPDRYGDDGKVSQLLIEKGFKIGFCKDVFCFNLELTRRDWGYTKEQLLLDPRKSGYSEPITYQPQDWDTLRPPEELIYPNG